jgi:hypothetical protein
MAQPVCATRSQLSMSVQMPPVNVPLLKREQSCPALQSVGPQQ